MDKKELIKYSIELLERELGQGKPYSHEQRVRLRDMLLNQVPAAIENAVNWLILNLTPGNLPTPQRFLDSVEIERKKLSMSMAIDRENQAARENREAPTLFGMQPPTELGRRSIAMMKKLFSDNPDYPEILSDCEEVARLYPHTNFPQLAEEWRKEWTERGRINGR